jgi:hypothetical protein
LCGSTRDVGEVVHRQMVLNTPYVRDLCSRCAGQVARAYYRDGGAPIEARRR